MEYNELLKANNINTLKILDINGLLREPRTLVPSKNDGGDKSDMIFDLLMDSTIRRGDGLVASTVQNESKQKIKEFVLKNEPINFVFQGFPFKCHNPIETLRKTPDLGELAFLQRLLDINETVRQIYSPGVNFTVLSESETYKDLFGSTDYEIDKYKAGIQTFLGKTGGNGTIRFIDFLDILNNKSEFKMGCKHEEEYLFASLTNPRISEEINKLVPVMSRSLPINQDVYYEDLLTVFGFNNRELTVFQKEFAEYIKSASVELAVKYLAIAKMKKDNQIIKSVFPNYIYVSTIARNDTYSFHPIHKRTRIFPHHGVPVLGSDKVDIVYFGEIITHPEVYTAVYLEGDIEDAPFYFLKGKQHIKKQV
ncbi:MAG: L-tyrosine/L-tryptophan isonitrile synthase family protein [Candidatus Woesebacteria bacterium]|nr:MAG: L-tyrosine/L-tryptophan isonitrile synthase family protein [Candidatus Woesebacteria bacterium]